MKTIKCEICYESFQSDLSVSNYMFDEIVMCDECYHDILDNQLK
jgi:hypothetical protein